MVDTVKSSIERKLQRDQSDRFTPVFHRKYPVLRERWSEAVRKDGNLAESPARVRFWRILTGSEHGHRNVPASEDLVIDGATGGESLWRGPCDGLCSVPPAAFRLW